MKSCILRSSHGDVTFDLDSGVVTEVDERADTEHEGCLKCIKLIDVKRLLELEPNLATDDEPETDILWAGYWYVDFQGEVCYEPPCQESIDESMRDQAESKARDLAEFRKAEDKFQFRAHEEIGSVVRDVAHMRHDHARPGEELTAAGDLVVGKYITCTTMFGRPGVFRVEKVEGGSATALSSGGGELLAWISFEDGRGWVCGTTGSARAIAKVKFD